MHTKVHARENNTNDFLNHGNELTPKISQSTQRVTQYFAWYMSKCSINVS